MPQQVTVLFCLAVLIGLLIQYTWTALVFPSIFQFWWTYNLVKSESCGYEGKFNILKIDQWEAEMQIQIHKKLISWLENHTMQ